MADQVPTVTVPKPAVPSPIQLSVTLPGEALAVRIIDLIILMIESTPMDVRQAQARDGWERYKRLLDFLDHITGVKP